MNLLIAALLVLALASFLAATFKMAARVNLTALGLSLLTVVWMLTEPALKHLSGNG